jgi:hypothetical protein
MRKTVVRVSIVAGLLIGLQGCASETASQASPLEGAWELVEARQTPPDPAFTLAEWRNIKIFTKTHWAYLSQKRAAPKLTSWTNDTELLAAAKAFGAGGGTYALEGDTYTEHIEFFAGPNYVGMSLPWKIKWEGDEWIQTGTFPMKSLGLDDHDLELYERYRRIK